MTKSILIFILCLSFISTAYAKSNSLCGFKDTDSEECKAISSIMYIGTLSGYIRAVIKQKKQKNQPVDESEEEQKVLNSISSDFFNIYFKKCGEEFNDFKKAQKCIILEISKKMLKSSN